MSSREQALRTDARGGSATANCGARLHALSRPEKRTGDGDGDTMMSNPQPNACVAELAALAEERGGAASRARARVRGGIITWRWRPAGSVAQDLARREPKATVDDERSPEQPCRVLFLSYCLLDSLPHEDCNTRQPHKPDRPPQLVSWPAFSSLRGLPARARRRRHASLDCRGLGPPADPALLPGGVLDQTSRFFSQPASCARDMLKQRNGKVC